MVRTMIESLLTDKSGYGKRTLRKDIGKNSFSDLRKNRNNLFHKDPLTKMKTM